MVNRFLLARRQFYGQRFIHLLRFLLLLLHRFLSGREATVHTQLRRPVHSFLRAPLRNIPTISIERNSYTLRKYGGLLHFLPPARPRPRPRSLPPAQKDKRRHLRGVNSLVARRLVRKTKPAQDVHVPVPAVLVMVFAIVLGFSAGRHRHAPPLHHEAPSNTDGLTQHRMERGERESKTLEETR